MFKCERCGDPTNNPEDDYCEHVCNSCLDNAAEAAYERQCESIYGGDGPKNLQQQQIESCKFK